MRHHPLSLMLHMMVPTSPSMFPPIPTFTTTKSLMTVKFQTVALVLDLAVKSMHTGSVLNLLGSGATTTAPTRPTPATLWLKDIGTMI